MAKVPTIVLWLLGANFIILGGRFISSYWNKHMKSYSYLGNDFPETLPLSLGKRELIFHNDVHLDINGTETNDPWSSWIPKSGGILRLGAEHRALNVVVFHQMHCLEMIHRSFQIDLEHRNFDHLQHCLFYLQEMFLCGADTTLEPGDFLSSANPHPQPYSRECKDWTDVWKFDRDNAVKFRTAVGDMQLPIANYTI